MSRYCLDTSAYSRFKRGEPRVTELIESAEWLGLPAAVLGELWLGFLGGRRADDNERELADFLAHPVVHALPLDADVARLFGEIALDLRRQGSPLPTNDVWIAAAAARHGATVLTFDPHFEAIRRVGALVLSDA